MVSIMNVVGARPQFIKVGPVSRALAEAGVAEILVHTGQHYDVLMSDAIMEDVGLRSPDLNLGVRSDSHATQTAQMLEGLENAILEFRPDAVLTYGDTNSTLAAALAASKLGVFTAHVEAGLRSFNRSMPEELNRVATDHLSDLLLAPTKTALAHLQREGLERRSALVGDVMVDALLSIDLDRVELPGWATTGPFYVATVHRPANTDDPSRLAAILEALGSLDKPVHLLAHPRLRDRLEAYRMVTKGSLQVHEPLPYAKMLAVMRVSHGLLTDSGGLQKEAFILGVPCTTLREETEWPETLEGGWNVLAGSRLETLPKLAGRTPDPMRSSPFGDGKAAARIVEEVLRRIP
ncbi:MAG: UDP-N-acetyl glucosamine 2-epimerase [Acidimicrobiia bacterium]|nr:MAG: UDP-N-acetyl glucosamine 2-epimerase [Acidimicrobiia bacterium]